MTTNWYSSRRVGEGYSGFKTLVEEGTDRILGAHLLGGQAEEVINVFAVAMRAGMSTTEVYKVSRLRSGFGLAAYGEKAVYPKFTVGGGYADVDRAILNSDRYGRGKRLFVTARIPLNEAFSILIFASLATDHAAANLPEQRIDVGLYYNVLSLLRKTHFF